MVQKIYLKMHPISCTNTHCDVTDLVNHGMVKNTKTWISWERNITVLQNKKILNLCLRWHILRSYHFVVEVTFKLHYVFSLNNYSHFLSCPISRCTIQESMHELCLSLHEINRLMREEVACITLTISLDRLNHVSWIIS